MLKISTSYQYMLIIFFVHSILAFQGIQGQQIDRRFDGLRRYEQMGLGLLTASWGIASASQLLFAVTENKCGVQPCESWAMGTIFGLGIAAFCGWGYRNYRANQPTGNRNLQALVAFNHNSNQPSAALQALLSKKKALKAPLAAIPSRAH
jgi:hypothetical protein